MFPSAMVDTENSHGSEDTELGLELPVGVCQQKNGGRY